MACLFGHKWDGCKCSKCAATRDDNHQWNGCKCLKCGKVRNEGHEWVDNKCKICGKVNLSNRFLVFIAYVGVIDLISLYGQRQAKDMIGIDKINWMDVLVNKYPSSKTMNQMIINNDEWSHPHTGNVDSRVDMNPFIIAATKHMTDKLGFSPEEATNAIMITANNNITVAAGNGLGVGQGFIVIGVPIK